MPEHPATRKVVCHLGKLKSGQLTGLQVHHQREKDSLTNPDIDSKRSHLNYDLHNDKPIKFLRAAKSRIKQAPKARVRKDSVYLIEAEISAGRKFWETASQQDQERFFREAYRFLSDRYGKENVVYSQVHLDEKTPHMHFGFVPITPDGRLNAQHVVMNRAEMGQIHQDLYKHLRERGLEVEKGEPAKEKHVQPQRWKAEQIEEKVGRVGEVLKDKMRALKEHTEALSTIQKREMHIDNIPVKEKGMFKKDRVELQKDDWDLVKGWAKMSLIYKAELNRTKEKVVWLEERNQGLEKDRVKARKFDQLGDLLGKDKVERVLEQQEKREEREKQLIKGKNLDRDR